MLERYNREGTKTSLLQDTDMESGSNANGHYIKFSEGTLICWGQYNSNGEDVLINFNIPFINNDFSISYSYEWYTIGYYVVFYSKTKSDVKVNFKDFANNVLTSECVLKGSWLAIGRWK